jgi:transcriptional regulator with XRE-family HTH domain
MEKGRSKRAAVRQRNKKFLLELLRRIRLDASVSQMELSKKLGKSQGFVSKYELGERRLDLPDLVEICDALQISLADFVKEFERARQG